MNRNTEIQNRLERKCSERIAASLARIAASKRTNARQDVSTGRMGQETGSLGEAYSLWPYASVVNQDMMIASSQPSVRMPEFCIHRIHMSIACDGCGRMAVRSCEDCGERLTFSGLHFSGDRCPLRAVVRDSAGNPITGSGGTSDRCGAY
jgi:hypothetical protein